MEALSRDIKADRQRDAAWREGMEARVGENERQIAAMRDAALAVREMRQEQHEQTVAFRQLSRQVASVVRSDSLQEIDLERVKAQITKQIKTEVTEDVEEAAAATGTIEGSKAAKKAAKTWIPVVTVVVGVLAELLRPAIKAILEALNQ